MLYFELEVNVLIVGYRGYGHSEGVPDEQGIALDAEAIYEWLFNCKVINNKRVFFMGKSLGGAVAIQLSEKLQKQGKNMPCGLILENTFTSIGDMVDHIFPFLANFKRLILNIYWPSLERIPHIKLPMLFVYGTTDEIVPPSHVQSLHDAATSAPFKQLHAVPGGSHNDTWLKGGKDYIYAIKDFLEKAQDTKLT
jgi:fermentation-respiration switch protein FrsA (DUF1100 family)